MKKLNFLIALFALIIGFSSCTEEEDSFSIVGTWTQESMAMTIDFGIPGLQPISETDTDPVTITFNGDGSGSATYMDEGVEVTDDFTWELANDVLTIIDPEATLSLSLTTMTDSKVVGEQSLDYDEFVEFAGLTAEEQEEFAAFTSLTVDLVITLVK